MLSKGYGVREMGYSNIMSIVELKLDVPNDDSWFWEPEFRKRR